MDLGCKRIEKSKLPEEVRKSMMIKNQDYYKKLALGLSTRGVSPEVPLYSEDDKYYYIPREFEIPESVESECYDERSDGEKVEFTSSLIPKKDQAPAIEKLSSVDSGILEAGCGKGKTCMAIDAMAKVGVTTLVLVHKTFLMNQWKERIKEFTGEDAGTIQGKVCDYKGKKVVIGMVQSLVHPEKYPEDMFRYFGLVITDEVHRIGSEEWSKVIRLFPSAKRWGLTATPNRADGMEEVFKSHIGDIVYTIKGENLVPRIAFVETPSVVKYDDYVNRYTGQPSIARLQTILSEDSVRNKQIVSVVENALKSGRKILVLGDRVDQLEKLTEEVNQRSEYDLAMLYVGKTKQEDRDKADDKSVRVIFGTLSLAKEGLDIPSLDTLMLISPNSAESTIQQATGRILREYEDKKEPIVIDFYDVNIGICKNMLEKRKRLYLKLGYRF